MGFDAGQGTAPSANQDYAKMEAAIEKAVLKAFRRNGCPLSEADRAAVPQLYGLIKDIGNGDIHAGVRNLRKDFALVRSASEKKNLITGAAVVMLCLWILSQIGQAVLRGFGVNVP